MAHPTKVFIFQVLAKYGSAVTALLVAFANIHHQRCSGLPKKQLLLAIVAEARTNEAPLLNFNEGITKEFLGIVAQFILNHRVDRARAQFTEVEGDWSRMDPIVAPLLSREKNTMAEVSDACTRRRNGETSDEITATLTYADAGSARVSDARTRCGNGEMSAEITTTLASNDAYHARVSDACTKRGNGETSAEITTTLASSDAYRARVSDAYTRRRNGETSADITTTLASNDARDARISAARTAYAAGNATEEQMGWLELLENLLEENQFKLLVTINNWSWREWKLLILVLTMRFQSMKMPSLLLNCALLCSG